MTSKVAIVKITRSYQEAFQRALSLIGGIHDINIRNRDVTIKIGVYDSHHLNHPTFEATKAVIEAFNRAPRIFLVESDNNIQKALERLQIWKKVFTDQVLPFSLTEDKNTKEVKIVGEKIDLSHILFKPNVRVSFHSYRASRGPGQAPHGAILKNLLGVIPDIKKERFHARLGRALVDILEVIGGIDLAVLDATYGYYGKWKAGKHQKQ